MPTTVQIEGVDADGFLRSLRFTTGAGFATLPTDSPAKAVFYPNVLQPGSVRRAIFRPGGSTFGQSETGYGVVQITNTGRWDHLINWAFDGRSIVIRRGSRGAAFPSGYTRVLSGTIEGVEFSQRVISFHIRDRQAEVWESLLTEEVYAGDNSAPSGLEGTADDIKGLPKPVAYGTVRNAQSTYVNTSRRIYQHRVNADLTVATTALYDRGVEITAEADYADLATLDSATAPSSARWKAYEGSATEGAYTRLGSAPDGVVTVDFTVGGSADRTAAAVIRRALLDAGVIDVDIIGASTVDSLTPYRVGFFNAGSETRVRDVIEPVAASIHGYAIATRSGQFEIGRLTAPVGVPKTTFRSDRLLDPQSALRRITGPSDGIPVWRVVVKYQRNWTPQKSEEIDRSVVTDARAEYLRLDYRTITVTDDAVKTRHPLAREIEVETLIDSETDATDLANFILGLYSVRRDIYEIKVRCTCSNEVDLTDLISVDIDRFDLSGGKLFRVIGIDEDLAQNTATLTIWG
jgi:hypothetical protein